MPAPFRVAVIIRFTRGYNEGVARGVAAFARSRANWVVHDVSPEPAAVRSLADWSPDGLIVVEAVEQLAADLRALARPVVNVNSLEGHEDFAFVCNDSDGVGRLGARHFLDRGFRHFAYLGLPRELFLRRREEGFVDELRRAGFDCHVYPGDDLHKPLREESWGRLSRSLGRWLGGLPRPLALMACHDPRGKEVLEVLREQGVRVPEEVAVLGVDDNESICQLTHPPLSSVRLAAERIGYDAAAKLARMADGERPDVLLIPPAGVTERQSTQLLAVGDADVRDAVAYIAAHAHGPLRIADVLRAVPVGRRTLEQKFRRHLGRSPADEVVRARLTLAKRLLAETDLPTSEVAARSGFTDAKHLALTFRKHDGATPTAYRRQHRAGPQAGSDDD